MKRTPVGIELFSGCGGITAGFLDAGLSIAAGFDIDRRSIEAYEYNHRHRGARGHAIDLTSVSGTQLLDLANAKNIDFIVGGPPCQPFSIVGHRRGVEDKRAQLVFEFLRLVRELGPTAVFFENVPNLSSVHGGALLKKLIRGLEALDFTVRVEIVAAADHGVPQIRRRLLMLAIRGISSVRMPLRTHSSTGGVGLRRYVTASDALCDLPDAADFGQCGIHNHEPTQHSEQMVARFAALSVGKRERSSFHDRLHPDRPSYTLRAGTGNFTPLRPIHYRYDRVITARESARLQGFPDDFIWPDWIPRLQQYRQIGNAVPPPVAKSIAEAIAAQLGWTLRPDVTAGNASRRPCAITMSDLERKQLRSARIRGASLGLALDRPEKSAKRAG